VNPASAAAAERQATEKMASTTSHKADADSQCNARAQPKKETATHDAVQGEQQSYLTIIYWT
jgi:hypothetical protein